MSHEKPKIIISHFWFLTKNSKFNNNNNLIIKKGHWIHSTFTKKQSTTDLTRFLKMKDSPENMKAKLQLKAHLFGANTRLMVRHLLVKQVDMLNTITMISFRFCPCQRVLSYQIYIFRTIVQVNPNFSWCWQRISGKDLLFCYINTLKTITRANTSSGAINEWTSKLKWTLF